MSARGGGAALVLAALVLGAVLASIGAATPAAPVARLASAVTTPVTGTLTGPTLLPTSGNGTYQINATGGPAFSDGTKVGNLTWHASLNAANTSGISLTPSSGNLTGTSAAIANLSLSGNAQTLTLKVLVSSVYGKENQSTNLSLTISIVVPYVVSAEIVNGAGTTVLAFPVLIVLDGTTVGSVTVPSLAPGANYTLSFRYASGGLSVGEHTFSLSLSNEHGLVRFANGETTYSTSFYVSAGPTSYTWWYVAGIVTFFGVLFIYASRVAARRSGQVRK